MKDQGVSEAFKAWMQQEGVKKFPKGSQVSLEKSIFDVFGVLDYAEVRVKGEAQKYYVLKADFDQLGEASTAAAVKGEIKAETQTATNIQAFDDPATPPMPAAAAGAKAGEQAAQYSVGRFYLLKADTGKNPRLTHSAAEFAAKAREQAAKRGYIKPEDQEAFAAAKKQAFDKTYTKGTSNKYNWQ